MQASERHTRKLVRYADDFVVMCPTADRAKEARRRAAMVLDRLRLSLSPEKTRIVELTKGKQGFDFLGFHMRKVESWKWRGERYLQRWPSAQAMSSIRAKIRALTDRSYTDLPLSMIVERLNPVLRGWSNYFRHGNSARKFAQIDSYVHERLAILACTKYQLSGRRSASRYNSAWLKRLGLHPSRHGPLRECECLAMKGVAEPCAGEPHALFDAAVGGAAGQSASPCG